MFCGNMNRLTEGNERPYDLADAIEYRIQHFQSTGIETVGAQEIKMWCQRWDKQVTDAVLRRVDATFHRRFGRGCIDWRR